MKNLRTRTGTALALAIALTTGGAALANSGPPSEPPPIPEYNAGNQPDGPDALATNCKRTYTNGSGVSAFNWCFSDDGNVVMLENSAGLEHIDIGTVTEGWCVSAGHSKRGQTNGQDPNFGLGNPIYTNTTKVAHRTTDGKLRVESGFGQSPANNKITITMKVRNVGTSPLNNVYLTRFVDADMSNGTDGDVVISGSRSVAAMAPGSSRLELIPNDTKYFANSMIFNDFIPVLDEDCYNATADTTTELLTPGDRSMAVQYQLGTIFPGEDKQAKFVYRISI